MDKYKLIFKRNLTLMAILISILGLSFWFLDFIQENKKIKNIPLGGSFILTDQNGLKYNSLDIKKKKLIYFGYTFCPDICPFDVLRISKLFDDNPGLSKTVQPVFITVDPERDTPENIKSFLENFNSKIVGLSGSKEQIRSVTKKFKIYVKYNRESKDDLNYLVDHSSLVFLIDENDNYLSFYRSNDFNEKVFKKSLEKIF